jgi:transcriptional regulator with XRE-family HTH domain
MRNRLAERREQLGLTKTDAAKRVGTSKQHYGRLESGETSLDPYWLKKIAKAFKCRPVDILPELGDGAPTAPLVGYVGAGEKVFNFDDGAFEQVEAPPGTGDVHVVRVRGDSMWPAYREGDLLFFAPADAMDTDKCLYRDCVVQVLGGPTYVKRIIPGPDPDTFTLASYRAPEILGVRVQWASPVLWVKRA